LFVTHRRGHFSIVRDAFVQFFAFFAHGPIILPRRIIRAATIIS
jgi:hypothetical protein